jgi:hypothetical protein
MAVVRWQFQDLTLLETYTFPVNPKDGFTPGVQKNITRSSTVAPDGLTLVWEGTDKPQDVKWSGVILTQAHLDAFTLWAQKRHQIEVTDDLGRVFIIYIESFVPTRAYKTNYPWRHTYEITATIVDWIG